MNYPSALFDLESYISGQRPSVAMQDFTVPSRSLPYPAGLPKEPQTLQNPLAFYQNPVFRQGLNDDPLLGMYESAYTTRREDDRRYQMPNHNTNLSDLVKQRKAPNAMQQISNNPQIPPLKSQRSQQNDPMRNKNIRPQSLNTPGKAIPPNMDIINLEADESLAQLLNPSRSSLDFMMNATNNRSIPYQNEEAINQALLLNSLGYGKQNTASLLPQLPDDNLYGLNGLNGLGGMDSLLRQSMGMENLYKQLQMDYMLAGLGTDQSLFPLLGQAAMPNPSMASMAARKPNPYINAEPILIDDSPESEMFVPVMYNNYDKERRAVKEEFMGKPSQPFQAFAAKAEMPYQQQSLNSKRMLIEQDPQMQIYSSPMKKIETNARKEAQVGRKIQPEVKPVKSEIKKPVIVKPERQLPVLYEGKMTPEKSTPTRQLPMPTEMFSQSLTISQDTPKKSSNEAQFVQTPTKNVQPVEFVMNSKPKELFSNKKDPKIEIDKIMLPETVITQQPPQEIPELQAKPKQSPTMLHLHKNQGQIQIEQNNAAPLQVKLVNTAPLVRLEKKLDPPAQLFDALPQGQAVLVNPLHVNQTPEKLATEVRGTTVQLFPVKEERMSVSTTDEKERSVGRRKRKDSAEIAGADLQSGRRDRKPNKLQMLRVAYQTYLDELKKPYKISVHIDPTNTDEKIVYAKVGEGYQVDVDALLMDPNFMNQSRKIVQKWNPDSVTPKKLEEYFTKFGQIIGQKITNEETALKNLEKFDMDVDKALDNASRNRLYYQNFFRLDQRQLRTRAAYVL